MVLVQVGEVSVYRRYSLLRGYEGYYQLSNLLRNFLRKFYLKSRLISVFSPHLDLLHFLYLRFLRVANGFGSLFRNFASYVNLYLAFRSLSGKCGVVSLSYYPTGKQCFLRRTRHVMGTRIRRVHVILSATSTNRSSPSF